MKYARLSHQSAPSPNWELLGELELRLNVNADSRVGEWLTVILSPLNLPMDFTSKIVTSAEEVAARAMQSETMIKYQHTHLIIYVPIDRSAQGRTWGFFRIEKVGADGADGSPLDHSIEFYLYLEGQ
jgi:hypothetical protein